MHLKLAHNLTLPPEAVTETFGILAKRGAGKSYTAGVLVEEMLEAQLPVCIVDPVGVWWGLRSSADGKRDGYPIIIFGGEHADVPLEHTAGEMMANLVIESRAPILLDLSGFSKGKAIQFMIDFAERLYHKNRDPLHLVLDEADSFAPQQANAGGRGNNMPRCLGAIENLVRRGRARGIGLTLISQRSAVLNKNVLTQIEVLVAMRTTSPQDKAAIDEWIKANGTSEERSTVMSSLAKLPTGEAWFWSPSWLEVFKRVTIRKKRTFDSSATPKVGQTIKPPKKLTAVDLDAIREQMKDTIEKAAAADPKKLQTEIKDRDKEISRLNSQVKRLTSQVEKLSQNKGKPQPVTQVVTNNTDRKALEQIKRTVDKALAAAPVKQASPVQTPAKSTAPASAGADLGKNGQDRVTPALNGFTKAETNVLRALYWLKDETANHTKVSFFSGYSGKSSSVDKAMGGLRTKGLVEGWQITAEGISMIPDSIEEKPSGKILREWLRPKISKASNAVLDVVIGAYPEKLHDDDIAEGAGYSGMSSSVSKALGQLRSLEAVTGYARDGGVKASDIFFK